MCYRFGVKFVVSVEFCKDGFKDTVSNNDKKKSDIFQETNPHLMTSGAPPSFPRLIK